MKKRLVFYITLIAVITVATFGVYRLYKPKPAVVAPSSGDTTVLKADYTAATITDYLVTQAKPVTMLFYTAGTSDSSYIATSIITPLLTKHGATSLDGLVMVDMTGIDTSDTASIKSRFGFYSWPSFSTVQVADGVTTVKSVLEWNTDTPLTYAQAETWLVSQGILTSVS